MERRFPQYNKRSGLEGWPCQRRHPRYGGALPSGSDLVAGFRVSGFGPNGLGFRVCGLGLLVRDVGAGLGSKN